MINTPPNILLIIVDQWRGDTLGFLGHPCIRTPNIDRLASEGVCFTQHYAQSSPCGPSRASLLTGQYLMNHRVVTNNTPTSRHLKTLPWFMRESGYEPALIGYTTTVPDPRVTDANDPRFRTNTIAEGWNIVRDFEGKREHYLAYLSGLGYAIPETYEAIFRPAPGSDESLRLAPSPVRAEHSETAWSIEGALDYIRIRKDQPWFMHLGTFRPHPPFMAPAPYHEMYDPRQVPRPVQADTLDSEKNAHPLTHLLLDTIKARSGVHYMEGLAAGLTVEDWCKMRAAYYGLCSEVDHHLGRVFRLLRDSGQDERTLIILTSDHGEQLGDHHLVNKRGYFPQSYHIPCIVRDPRPAADAARGRKISAFTENIDVLPTILDWLGREPSHQFDGRSLMPFVHGGEPLNWRREAHWEYDFRDMAGGLAAQRLAINPDSTSLAVVRDESFAYVHFAELPPLLFDLARDPHWMRNVAEDPAYAPASLRYARLMLDWRLRHADRTLTGLSISSKGLVGTD
jgi:arylsulfatase A-like enzyme